MKLFQSNIKSICIMYLCYFQHIWVFAQSERLFYTNDFDIIDSAKLEITYKLDWVEDTINPNATKRSDVQKLLIGKNLTKTFSYLQFQNDSICAIYEKSDRDFPSDPPGAVNEVVIIEKIKPEVTVLFRLDEMIFKYHEPLPDLKWKMHEEFKIILTYNCQKATVYYRGRYYTAWFAKAFPVSHGPYKFTGLPGLILELRDSRSHYVYTCIGIKNHKSPMPIKNRKWNNNIETTREKLNQLLVRKHSDASAYYQSIGMTYWAKINGKYIKSPLNHKIPYNPIELE